MLKSNTVTDFYAHFGNVEEAQRTFAEIAQRGELNVVCVGSLRKALLSAENNKRCDDALALSVEHRSLRNDDFHSNRAAHSLKYCAVKCVYVWSGELECRACPGSPGAFAVVMFSFRFGARNLSFLLIYERNAPV